MYNVSCHEISSGIPSKQKRSLTQGTFSSILCAKRNMNQILRIQRPHCAVLRMPALLNCKI